MSELIPQNFASGQEPQREDVLTTQFAEPITITNSGEESQVTTGEILDQGSLNNETLDGANLVIADNTNNTFDSGLNDDTVFSGLGDDNISGNEGNDFLSGEEGNDSLIGGRGDDLVSGGTGDDQLFGGQGADNVLGGIGNDILFGDDESADSLTSGNDFLDGGEGNDEVRGNRGNDTVRGGSGSDTIRGGKGDDLVDGGEDNDLLIGGKGADTLTGGEGADTFVFEFFDSDTLGGEVSSKVFGSGSDTLNFNTFVPISAGVDTLTDFTPGEDKIGLDSDSFDLLKTEDGNFNSNEFTTLANFGNNRDANLVYDSEQGVMYYIVGENRAIEFMRLDPGLNIDDDDFEII